MWYNRRSLLIQISFGVLLAVLLSTGSYSVAKADYFGRAEGHGYFKDHDEGGEYDDSSNVLSKRI